MFLKYENVDTGNEMIRVDTLEVIRVDNLIEGNRKYVAVLGYRNENSAHKTVLKGYQIGFLKYREEKEISEEERRKETALQRANVFAGMVAEALEKKEPVLYVGKKYENL